jgi:hypothetical protein
VAGSDASQTSWDNGGVCAMSYDELELAPAICGAPETFRIAYPRIGY